MESRALKSTYWFTHIVCAVSTLGILLLAWNFKSALQIRGNLEESQFQLRSKLEKFREKNPFEEIHQALRNVKPAVADDKLTKLDRQMSSLEKELGLVRGKELEQVFQDHRKTIQDVGSFSRPDELLLTISQKANKLTELAKRKSWKNLARLSERLEDRVAQLRDSEKVESPQVKFMESDLTAMSMLIRGSSLAETDKDEIFRQLEGIRQEVAMLLELHQNRRSMQQELGGVEASFSRWMARADLGIASLKHKAQTDLEKVLAQLWMMGALCLVSWLMMGVCWAWLRKSQRRNLDQTVVSLLNKSVLGDHTGWEHMVGESRRDEIHRTLQIIKKRLHLGQDLQMAMPFACLMLNDKGQLVWANELFCEQFHLDLHHIDEEFIHWENLRQRLTGMENDPVIRSLETLEAGTFQTQLIMDDGAQVPFEMHVSPIDGKNGRRTVVTFYPLALMRETIQSQAKLVMEPVRMALAALESDSWGVEVENRLAPLWCQVGFSEDWNQLRQVIHRMEQLKLTLLQQIHELEDKNHDYMKLIAEFSGSLEKRSGSIKNQHQILKDIKDNLVSLDSLETDLVSDHGVFLNETKAHMKRTEHIREAARSLGERFHQAKETLHALEKGRAEQRLARQEILEAKNGLVQIHNQLINLLPNLHGPLANNAAEMKDALSWMDASIAQLETRQAALDIHVTKLSMAFAGPHIEWDGGRSMSGPDLASHERIAQEIKEEMREDQEQIIQHLKNLVEKLRQDSMETHLLKAELVQEGSQDHA